MRQGSFNPRRLAAVVGGGLAALALAGAAPAPAMAPQSLAGVKAALAHCRQTADVAARAACYDSVTDTLIAAPAGDAEAEPQPEGAVAPALPTPDVAAKAAKPPAGSRAGTVTSADSDYAKVRTHAVIAAVAVNDRGYLRLTTTAGEVWDQTQAFNVTQLPHAGDKLVISRTFLGGHWCRLGPRDVFHCKQAK
jgi:hypothetical protein